jgi:hypothetical protein
MTRKEGRKEFVSVQDAQRGQARLGPRARPIDEATGKPKPKPSDYDLWL